MVTATRAAGIVAVMLFATACGPSETSSGESSQTPPSAQKTVLPAPPPEAGREIRAPSTAEDSARLEALLPKIEGDSSKTLVRDDSTFALALYRELSGLSGNIVFSPQSISTLMAWISAGARGETQSEIRKVLRFSLPDDALHEETARLDEYLELRARISNATLESANSLWVRPGLPLVQSFVKLSRARYGAEPYTIDFKEDPVGAARRINAWVSENTRRRIERALSPSDISSVENAVVLLGAVYFKGKWTYPFEVSKTRSASFCVPGSGTVEVPMMHRLAHLNYAETNGLRALELPYGDGNLTMVVLLPTRSNGLSSQERSLTFDKLSVLLGRLKEGQVELAFPKFEFEFRQKLRQPFGKMGMSLAFTEQADLHGMADLDSPLFLGAVDQVANITVDEEGTVASGTGEGTISLGEDFRPQQFVADHPFLFLIRDTTTGAILFFGRVDNPNPGAPVKPGSCSDEAQ